MEIVKKEPKKQYADLMDFLFVFVVMAFVVTVMVVVLSISFVESYEAIHATQCKG